MSIGGGIFLMVVGAIMAFAFNFQLARVDIRLIGYILLAAGLLVLVFGIISRVRRRRYESTYVVDVDPVTGERVTRRIVEEGGPEN
ncbi:hypothetical protein EDF24_2625 [Curtobacterium sp. PhB130]|uniref:DUF6458 family protein n=1 Tax=unclassified Curtobacterium TaxID=257496 RepID=UPI000F4B27D5|nr:MULTISPECIES: DUF6458 family protein [unclassified Curtobacterium]ROS75181.1 hypothetical protein EDF24_2625 [Curtobacterium sp. PhB130]TCK63806.1 hypothetical protein EDF27_2353 [Curtobacterium sp. PhB136]